MDEPHTTQCCPERLVLTISWCAREHHWEVMSQWVQEGQIWADEPAPAGRCSTDSEDNLAVLLRAVLGGYRRTMAVSRTRAHSLARYRSRAGS